VELRRSGCLGAMLLSPPPPQAQCVGAAPAITLAGRALTCAAATVALEAWFGAEWAAAGGGGDGEGD
jgi:hypothetical protein